MALSPKRLGFVHFDPEAASRFEHLLQLFPGL